MLDPPVAGVGGAPRQAALLEHVGDRGDERGIAVHPLAQVLHRHRGVERVQGLDEDGRDGQPLGDPLHLPDHPPGELEDALLDLGVQLAPARLTAARLPGARRRRVRRLLGP